LETGQSEDHVVAVLSTELEAPAPAHVAAADPRPSKAKKRVMPKKSVASAKGVIPHCYRMSETSKFHLSTSSHYPLSYLL
jgi:hypothetical protein